MLRSSTRQDCPSFINRFIFVLSCDEVSSSSFNSSPRFWLTTNYNSTHSTLYATPYTKRLQSKSYLLIYFISRSDFPLATLKLVRTYTATTKKNNCQTRTESVIHRNNVCRAFARYVWVSVLCGCAREKIDVTPIDVLTSLVHTVVHLVGVCVCQITISIHEFCLLDAQTMLAHLKAQSHNCVQLQNETFHP